MKTRLSNTSLQAYENNKANLGDQERAVLDCITANKAISATDVSKTTGIRINAVAGRINGLLHKQLIKVSGTQQPRNVNLYSLRYYYEPFNTFPESWEEKYNSLKVKYETVVANARRNGIDIEQTVMF